MSYTYIQALGSFSFSQQNAITDVDAAKSVTINISDSTGASSKNDIEIVCGNDQQLC